MSLATTHAARERRGLAKMHPTRLPSRWAIAATWLLYLAIATAMPRHSCKLEQSHCWLSTSNVPSKAIHGTVLGSGDKSIGSIQVEPAGAICPAKRPTLWLKPNAVSILPRAPSHKEANALGTADGANNDGNVPLPMLRPPAAWHKAARSWLKPPAPNWCSQPSVLVSPGNGLWNCNRPEISGLFCKFANPFCLTRICFLSHRMLSYKGAIHICLVQLRFPSSYCHCNHAARECDAFLGAD